MQDKVGNILYIESIADTGNFLREKEFKIYRILIKCKKTKNFLYWLKPLKSGYNIKEVNKIIVKIIQNIDTDKEFKN